MTGAMRYDEPRLVPRARAGDRVSFNSVLCNRDRFSQSSVVSGTVGDVARRCGRRRSAAFPPGSIAPKRHVGAVRVRAAGAAGAARISLRRVLAANKDSIARGGWVRDGWVFDTS